MIPSHIASLCLTSTKSGTAGDFPKPIVLSTFAKILSGVAATPEKAIPNVVTMLFPQAYLAEARESDPEKRTNRQVLEKVRSHLGATAENPPLIQSSVRLGVPHALQYDSQADYGRAARSTCSSIVSLLHQRRFVRALTSPALSRQHAQSLKRPSGKSGQSDTPYRHHHRR